MTAAGHMAEDIIFHNASEAMGRRLEIDKENPLEIDSNSGKIVKLKFCIH